MVTIYNTPLSTTSEKALFGRPGGGSGTEYSFRTVEACFLHRMLPKTHRTWLYGAQGSGWQLPLRGLFTSGSGRGRVRRSCRLIFLCLFCAFSTQNKNPKMVKCFPISL